MSVKSVQNIDNLLNFLSNDSKENENPNYYKDPNHPCDFDFHKIRVYFDSFLYIFYNFFVILKHFKILKLIVFNVLCLEIS